ncbi:MAG TPA: protein-L-isoaspartate(D-aspartate) O-methyltransferase [Polyangia bacterium]
MDFTKARARMVDHQLAGRGITDSLVLAAFREVPREAFLPAKLREFAYRDAPLPIGDGQTISQPYIVAVTIAALELTGDERVLEVGTGSGYAAAVLSRIAKDVVTIERLASLGESARERLAELGYDNVEVVTGDGTLGWPARAPYDAIAVAAGGPVVPEALKQQLAVGGRLVIPVGPEESSQQLLRVTRVGHDEFREEAIADVRFVPLIGQQGWPEESQVFRTPGKTSQNQAVARLIHEVAEPIRDIDADPLDAILDRVGDARLVLLGEATHGTSEFYRMRARITKALIEQRGFDFVAVEADWPDAARVDDYVIGARPRSKVAFAPFSRFPTWMWRNREVHDFLDWLRARNLERRDRRERVGFHGLDLYSMFTSMAAVISYLDDVDPGAARVARERYGALTPWQKDPAAYGRAVLVEGFASSETAVVAMLRDMLQRRVEYVRRDGERFFDATQNARVVANAERYYRAMYYAGAASWNLRDSHMFETLQALLTFYGPQSRGVVWEHNSHVGDAAATEMNTRGELNVGQLCRDTYDKAIYIVGFGTDHGTVAAASNWGDPMQRMQVRPAHADSYERVFHQSGRPAFLLPLRQPRRQAVRDELMAPRLERAIGVVYRPESELSSHYFYATLPHQFDEWIWFDETSAVEPLRPVAAPAIVDLPETYPFGV